MLGGIMERGIASELGEAGLLAPLEEGFPALPTEPRTWEADLGLGADRRRTSSILRIAEAAGADG
ncbi:hypothetical protein FRC03_003685 [Tulasnella sp. 419]|nr:hypothetical protein FRC03_003685 [Tulasnella sp. 419]